MGFRVNWAMTFVIFTGVDRSEDAKSHEFQKAQQRSTHWPYLIETKRVENRAFRATSESALGAGGREFESPRPDQLKTSALFAMLGFGPPSAPVMDCGNLGFLGAPDSYKIDYVRVGWTPPTDRQQVPGRCRVVSEVQWGHPRVSRCTLGPMSYRDAQYPRRQGAIVEGGTML